MHVLTTSISKDDALTTLRQCVGLSERDVSRFKAIRHMFHQNRASDFKFEDQGQINSLDCIKVAPLRNDPSEVLGIRALGRPVASKEATIKRAHAG
jgi:hypothetical protein